MTHAERFVYKILVKLTWDTVSNSNVICLLKVLKPMVPMV